MSNYLHVSLSLNDKDKELREKLIENKYSMIDTWRRGAESALQEIECGKAMENER